MTSVRMETKVKPETIVVTKPAIAGRRENFPIRIGGTLCAKKPAT